jgi:hypothetical protein
MDQISATIELSPEEDLKGLNFGTEDWTQCHWKVNVSL